MFIYLFLGWMLSSLAGKELDRRNRDVHQRIMNIGERISTWREESYNKTMKEIEDYLVETNKDNKQ